MRDSEGLNGKKVVESTYREGEACFGVLASYNLVEPLLFRAFVIASLARVG
jgi:hypothetical protein